MMQGYRRVICLTNQLLTCERKCIMAAPYNAQLRGRQIDDRLLAFRRRLSLQSLMSQFTRSHVSLHMSMGWHRVLDGVISQDDDGSAAELRYRMILHHTRQIIGHMETSLSRQSIALALTTENEETQVRHAPETHVYSAATKRCSIGLLRK